MHVSDLIGTSRTTFPCNAQDDAVGAAGGAVPSDSSVNWRSLACHFQSQLARPSSPSEFQPGKHFLDRTSPVGSSLPHNRLKQFAFNRGMNETDGGCRESHSSFEETPVTLEQIARVSGMAAAPITDDSASAKNCSPVVGTEFADKRLCHFADGLAWHDCGENMGTD